MRVPHLSPTTLTTDEQRLALQATAGSLRDHTIISLALGTGLRLAEIVGLDVGDAFAPDGRRRESNPRPGSDEKRDGARRPLLGLDSPQNPLYLACGRLEGGFAPVRYPTCRAEHLVVRLLAAQDRSRYIQGEEAVGSGALLEQGLAQRERGVLA